MKAGSNHHRCLDCGIGTGWWEKGLVYCTEYHSVGPFVWIGFPAPFSQASECLPRLNPGGGGGTHSHAVNSDDRPGDSGTLYTVLYYSVYSVGISERYSKTMALRLYRWRQSGNVIVSPHNRNSKPTQSYLSVFFLSLSHTLYLFWTGCTSEPNTSPE